MDQNNLPQNPTPTAGLQDNPPTPPVEDIPQSTPNITTPPIPEVNPVNTETLTAAPLPSADQTPPETVIPPVENTIMPPDDQPKKSKAKIIGAIAGVVILLASVAAGVILVQRNQELREQASSPAISGTPTVSPPTIDPDVERRLTFSAIGADGTGTEEVTVWLNRNGNLQALGSTRASDGTNSAWQDSAPVTLPAGSYKIVFIPTSADGIQGSRSEVDLVVGSGSTPAPAASGPPQITGTVDVDPKPLEFLPNKESRIGISMPAQNESTTDAVTAWLFRSDERLNSLTIATKANGWKNTDIWPANIAAGSYTLKVIPKKGTAEGASQDFPLTVKAGASTMPQLIGKAEADPTTFEIGSTRRISLHAVGDGNTDEVVAYLFKPGQAAAITAIGSTKAPQWRNDDPGPQTKTGVTAGSYTLKFIPTKGNKDQGTAQEIPITITPAGAPAAAGDARCSLIELAIGGSDISPTTVKVGDSLNATIFCFTTDTTDDFDKIRYTLISPDPNRPPLTQDLVAVREQSRDSANKRFFIAKFNFNADKAGSYTIKGWGHTPKKGWKGQS